MARRKDSVLDDLFEVLKVMPAWVGPVLAGVLFVLLRFVGPMFIGAPQNGVDPGVLWRPAFAMFSWLLGGAVLVVWVAAEVWKLVNRRMLDGQEDLESIRRLSWRELERLVGEAYRRRGYVAEVGPGCNDGGVDVRLRGHGQRVLVQCKQWKAWRVGVGPVRELLGVVVSEGADRGIVVTCGRFTREARAFAGKNPRIELVDGAGLERLVLEVRRDGVVMTPPAAGAPPLCPVCRGAMVLRTARQGRNAGSQFWGCGRYPRCKGIREVDADVELAREL